MSVTQTQGVIRQLRRLRPDLDFVLCPIVTLGDRKKEWQRSDRGIFVKEIEDALRRGRIDLAVHSAKDLPSRIPRGLVLAGLTRRLDCRDVLILRPGLPAGRRGRGLSRLPEAARVGTSSLRRAAQLLRQRPDLRVFPLRGNLDTRLAKLDRALFDAVVVAAAGMRRLGIRRKRASVLSSGQMLPACGQGCLALEARQTDNRVRALCRGVDHWRTRICVTCERAFLRASRAGCRMPVAAHARLAGSRLSLEAMIISLDGTRCVRLRETAGVSQGAALRQADRLGEALARRLLANGGSAILAGIKDGHA